MTEDNTQKTDVTKTPDPAAPYRPEGLPEHLAGADEKETLDKVFKAYDGARRELGKKSGVAEKPDDYKIDLPEDLSKKILRPGEDGKDALFETVRTLFHEGGVNPGVAAGVMTKFYEAVAAQADEKTQGDQKQLDAMDADFKEFGGPDKAKGVIDANAAWITGLKTKGIIDDKDAAEMAANLQWGAGLRWLDKLRVLTGEKPIPADMGKQSGGDAMTEENLHAMMRDERYWKTKDPAYIAEVTGAFQEFYNKAA